MARTTTDRNMIRVLNVLHDERVGGPQLRVLQVALGLRSEGYETLVAIPRGDRTFASRLKAAGIEPVELNLVRLRNSLNPVEHGRFAARFWPNVWALRQAVRAHDIQVIHTNGLIHLQGPIAARLEGVGLVWHLNDVTTPRPLRLPLVPLARRWADRIAVAAQAVIEHYFRDPTHVGEQVEVLYAPVDTRKFNPLVSSSSVRAELGIGHDHLVVGTVSNIHPGKGIEFLLRAAPAIKERFPDTRFLIVGERLANHKRYNESLIQLVERSGLKDDVVFTGRRDDMPEVMAAMTVYVHPSRFEACPMAVLEASATGLPVVAADVGGTRELVAGGTTGVLVPPRSPDAIARAVIRLLGSPPLAAEMGKRGALRMQNMFSVEACVAQHVRVYEGVLQCLRNRQTQDL